MANRLLQEGGDARLEAMYGDLTNDGDVLPESIGRVKSWEDGAAEVADMIGAEVGTRNGARLCGLASRGIVCLMCATCFFSRCASAPERERQFFGRLGCK